MVSVTIAARRGDRTNADQQAQQRQRDRLPPRTDPDPSEDGGVAGSLQGLLFGENPDSSESGGFQLPPGLPISPEVDYQIASSFYRGQLQAAQTGRQQAAVARATPQKPPPVYAQPSPRELPERRESHRAVDPGARADDGADRRPRRRDQMTTRIIAAATVAVLLALAIIEPTAAFSWPGRTESDSAIPMAIAVASAIIAIAALIVALVAIGRSNK